MSRTISRSAVAVESEQQPEDDGNSVNTTIQHSVCIETVATTIKEDDLPPLVDDDNDNDDSSKNKDDDTRPQNQTPHSWWMTASCTLSNEHLASLYNQERAKGKKWSTHAEFCRHYGYINQGNFSSWRLHARGSPEARGAVIRMVSEDVDLMERLMMESLVGK
eukprot:TRINITY_DN7286_c0_g1_i2.p1 TRINITY_DN7286_c0_g1~~TRINITY_DN7286_c0_g1_i2.p1  ORF type:complete len:163 (+),score=25.55 TRINITY_DN7286_c0_g1_i2:65-553(+)